MHRPADASRLRAASPDPARFWIRYSPRLWPGPSSPWTHLAAAELGEAVAGANAEIERAVDDLLYLPPVVAPEHEARLETARARLEEGAPVLLQLFPGEMPPLSDATVVYDLLPSLLERRFEPWSSLPPQAVTVWPLLPGLTTEPELWRRGCERLAIHGVAVAQPLVLSLSPESRRRLAEGRSEEIYRALFHGEAPSELAFARVAASFGLKSRMQRPLPRPPLSGAANRRLAGELMCVAELWMALDRPAGQGLALWRAARWVDGSGYDVAALCRDGNLGVVPELDKLSRLLLAELVETGKSRLYAELLAESVV